MASTTDVLKVDGDYRLKTPNGDIYLDTTNGFLHTGTVYILGNLNVTSGTTFTVVENEKLQNNLIYLNAGESGNIVTLGNSGLVIARGPSGTDALSQAATLLWVDKGNGGGLATWSTTSTTYQGYFQMQAGNAGTTGTDTALFVSAIRTTSGDGSLNLLGPDNQYGILTMDGVSGYYARLISRNNPNDIPNKEYVDNALFTGTQFARQIKVGNSFITVNDSSLAFNDPLYASQDKFEVTLGSTSNVVLSITNNGVAKFSGLTLANESISVNTGTTSDLTLIPSVGYGVDVNGYIRLLGMTAPANTLSNYTTVYYSNSTVGGGGTGLFFVNSKNTDELVSRRKAIIYGIIF